MNNKRAHPLEIIILAAGSGTRMKSSLPKVMHEIAGLPMISHVTKLAESLNPDTVTVVVAPSMDDVASTVSPHSTAVQKTPQGTADAVKAGLQNTRTEEGSLLVLYGDGPLYTKETLQAFVSDYEENNGCGLSFLAMKPENPFGYGRMITDENDHVIRIVEQKEANAEEQSINLCWTGVMCGDIAKIRNWIEKIDNNNSKGEYYLTDLPKIARETDSDKTCYSLCAEEESLGANTRGELAKLEAKMQKRLREKAMENGVTLIDPDSVTFSEDTVLGQDVIVEPNVIFGPGVRVGDKCRIRGFSYLEDVILEKGCVIGPFARLRPGTHLEDGVKVGNFVEVKGSHMGKGAKANHLAYIGNAEIGAGSNIGAGTITCNYDGFDKHKTTIGEGVFVGSNSTLVAPLTLSDGAYVAAGSVITKNVPEDTLAVARARPIMRDGWAKSYRERKSKKD